MSESKRGLLGLGGGMNSRSAIHFHSVNTINLPSVKQKFDF